MYTRLVETDHKGGLARDRHLLSSELRTFVHDFYPLNHCDSGPPGSILYDFFLSDIVRYQAAKHIHSFKRILNVFRPLAKHTRQVFLASGLASKLDDRSRRSISLMFKLKSSKSFARAPNNENRICVS